MPRAVERECDLVEFAAAPRRRRRRVGIGVFESLWITVGDGAAGVPVAVRVAGLEEDDGVLREVGRERQLPLALAVSDGETAEAVPFVVEEASRCGDQLDARVRGA